MSINENDGVMSCLFSGQDMTLDNLKFFRGDAKVVRVKDFENEFCASEGRKQRGELTPGEPSISTEGPVDVREWINSL